MNLHGLSTKHVNSALVQIFVDVALFFWAFYLGYYAYSRMPDAAELNFIGFLPGIIVGSFFFVTAAYIVGLYSANQLRNFSFFKQILLLVLCLGIGMALMTAIFYLDFSSRIGRGIMFLSVHILVISTVFHHLLISRMIRFKQERVAFLVSSLDDELELKLLDNFDSKQFKFVGVIHGGESSFTSSLN